MKVRFINLYCSDNCDKSIHTRDGSMERKLLTSQKTQYTKYSPYYKINFAIANNYFKYVFLVEGQTIRRLTINNPLLSYTYQNIQPHYYTCVVIMLCVCCVWLILFEYQLESQLSNHATPYFSPRRGGGSGRCLETPRPISKRGIRCSQIRHRTR